MGGCLGSRRAKFECILGGLGGLGSSPEGRTGGGGMGRTVRAGVRVGLFVCLCLCRERPPCEGFPSSVPAEGSEAKFWVFPVRRVLLVASWPRWRALGGFRNCPEEGETRRKGGFSCLFEEFTTNRRVGLSSAVGPSCGPIAWCVHEQRPTGKIRLPDRPTERPGNAQTARARPTTA